MSNSSSCQTNKNSGARGLAGAARRVAIAMALAALALTGAACGGGGGGGSVVTPQPSTPTTISLESGLGALNSATPDYATAKSQFNQVIAASDATSEQKATAYSGLGWAGVKSAAGVADIDKAIEDFSSAINSQPQQSQTLTVVNQAYVGRSVSRIIKESAALTSAISDLDSAGFASLDAQYRDDAIKTGITTPQIRGYKAFLHLIRNESVDGQLFTDNYNRLKSSSAGDRNAQLMLEALDMMLKEN